jgi:hypothetical protein
MHSAYPPPFRAGYTGPIVCDPQDLALGRLGTSTDETLVVGRDLVARQARRPRAKARRRRPDAERRAIGAQAAIAIRDGRDLARIAREMGLERNTLRGMPGVREALALAVREREERGRRRRGRRAAGDFERGDVG